jgi:glycosyltransferase involved in cell wall biosynthesis
VTPRCTVVVPTHERPGALAACLESLAALDYPGDRFEVVVVDDGGRTPLEPVLDAFRDRLDLQLVRQARAGPAAARNAGAEHARGDLLLFTDDDCRPRADWLRRLAERVAASPEEAFGGRTVNALPDNVYSAAAQLVIDVGYRQNNTGAPDRRWFTTNNLAVPAAGFRALGGFDPSYRTAEDRDFCSRWVQSGLRMSYEPRAVVEHANPLTLGSFVTLFFSYGRGAFRYHREQRRAGRPVPFEPSFYIALASAPLEEHRRRRLALEGLLLLWHVTNTAGFVSEWARTALNGGRSRGSRASAGRR